MEKEKDRMIDAGGGDRWEEGGGGTNCEVFHFDFPRGCMLPRHFSLLFELNAMQF